MEFTGKDGTVYESQPEVSRASCEGCALQDTDDCRPAHWYRDCLQESIVWVRKEGAPTTKLSNPKQALGDKKLPLHLVPATAIAYEATAFAEGALKYGTANWRVAGVQVSTYLAAALRHIEKYANGEDFDPVSLVHHLANARACLGIVLDAAVCGKLTDDRPPRADLNPLFEELQATLAHLKELHKDCNPKHYTELDKEPA